MAKAMFEKTIKITPKPAKKIGIMPSYSDGQKQSKVEKPKSLTPLKNASSRKK